MFAMNIENLEKLYILKLKYILLKILMLSVVYSKCGHEYEKYLRKKNQLEC